MIQEELNFNIATLIQDELEGHAFKMETIAGLLGIADSSDLHIPNLEFGLSQLIFSWLEEQKGIVDRVVEEVSSTPGYVQVRAKELLRLKSKGFDLSTYSDAEEITHKLKNVIEAFGQAYPEAPGLLDSLKAALQEEGGKSLRRPEQVEPHS